MSVDRGYLGRAPGDRVDPHLHRSMDDLTFQKTKGLELVRLLRVSSALSPQQIFLYIRQFIIYERRPSRVDLRPKMCKWH